MDAKGAPFDGSVKRPGSHRTSVPAEKLLDLSPPAAVAIQWFATTATLLYDGRAYISSS
jgi:hypothetical protein